MTLTNCNRISQTKLCTDYYNSNTTKLQYIILGCKQTVIRELWTSSCYIYQSDKPDLLSQSTAKRSILKVLRRLVLVYVPFGSMCTVYSTSNKFRRPICSRRLNQYEQSHVDVRTIRRYRQFPPLRNTMTLYKAMTHNVGL